MTNKCSLINQILLTMFFAESTEVLEANIKDKISKPYVAML